MDPRFPASREDLYNLQMELKQVQYTQNSHAERLLRLEKRQADDAALKSVWNSPFPGVLSGTPQHGPVQIPQNEIFDDLDEQGEQLLGSLHLGPAEEEPVRRGAASRANSVRFDESALHGSSWGGQNSRHSGEFAPIRPGSGLMMERSLSHKSDGRHSSAGHSVHSVHSHHSAASGRASSLGLDTNYAVDDDDSDSFEMPEPPPSLFVLGTVPSIVRCWLTTNFAHPTLLYADVCTGSQKSTVDYSLLEELDLLDEIHHDVDGAVRVRLNVYFAEASVTHHGNRAGSPRGPVPSITVYFEVSGADRSAQSAGANPIRIFLGSDALRAHSADVLFSKNFMTLYDDERDRLRVPFVRPEDHAVFRNICTANIVQEKHKLNANAAPFILGETISAPPQDEISIMASGAHPDDSSHRAMSPMGTLEEPVKPSEPCSSASDTGLENDKLERDANGSESGSKGSRRESGPSEAPRRDASGIWGSWRHGTVNGVDNARENGLSGYQPAGRGTRNMKVLKPMKSSSTSARTGVSYEPPPPSKGLSEGRRRSQVNLGADKENGPFPNRWDTKRTASIGSEPKLQAQAQPPASREVRQINTLPRSANPVGGASAFSWMTPSTKPKTTAGMD